MAKHKSPYTYPHKSRAGMVEYLASHDSYGGWNHPYRKWSPLSWNVKIGNVNNDGKQGDCKTSPEFDEAWERHVAKDAHLWEFIIEDMQRPYAEGEYTTYPGDDQGNWEFCFAGRSGGHMLLMKWEDLDLLKQFDDEDSWREWLEEIMFSTLQTLYKAVRCMDYDFGPGQVERAFEYQLNFHRSQWEETHASEIAFNKAEAGLEPCPVI